MYTSVVFSISNVVLKVCKNFLFFCNNMADYFMLILYVAIEAYVSVCL